MKHAKSSLTQRKNNARRLWFAIPGTIGLSLLVIGGGILWQDYRQTHSTPSTIDSRHITTHSTDKPEETPPDCANYRVASNKPRRIILPSIKSEGCIVQVGIDQHGAIAVPGNIHLAGWYTNSVLPGEKGVSMIDGHVSGKYSPGIFKDLHKLKAKDNFSIEFGDKKVKNFKVVDTNTLSVDDTTKKMYEQITGVEQQVNLITCTGAFNKETQRYEKRILIRAKRL